MVFFSKQCLFLIRFVVSNVKIQTQTEYLNIKANIYLYIFIYNTIEGKAQIVVNGS